MDFSGRLVAEAHHVPLFVIWFGCAALAWQTIVCRLLVLVDVFLCLLSFLVEVALNLVASLVVCASVRSATKRLTFGVKTVLTISLQSRIDDRVRHDRCVVWEHPYLHLLWLVCLDGRD